MSVAPKKSLGQHFLVDENILGVIGRLADLRAEDVVLEIGPGLGVLTRYLASRVRFVHARRARPLARARLRDALGAADNVALVWGDALRLDIDALAPAPAKLVANLPYNIATPLVVETLEHARRSTVVRDGAARGRRPLLREPAYEGVRRGLRPRPARRAQDGLPPRAADGLPAAAARGFGSRRLRASRDLPDRTGPRRGRGAFAHRRKTVANSISNAGLATRTEVEEALASIDLGAAVRAEEIEPAAFVALAEALA